MKDAIPNDLRPPIDARSLNARAAARGAVRGFCWSLVVALPLAAVVSNAQHGGPFWALFALVTTCSIWSVVAAFVNIGRVHEERFPAPRQEPIDARPLIASAALRGGVGGFCWSLVVALPLAGACLQVPGSGPFLALIALGSICSIWTAAAATAEKRRAREKTFTDEQRAVLRRHLVRTRIQVACVSVLLIGLAAAIPNPSPPVAPICTMIILSIAITSDLVGRAKGNAAVRAMQQQTRDAACRLDAHPLAVANNAPPSTLVQPSMVRFTETQPAALLEAD